MKKIICILLTLMLTAAFIACGSEKGPNESKDILDISNDPSEYTESNGFWENNASEKPSEASDADSDNTSLVVYPSSNKESRITLGENDSNTILGHINTITDWKNGVCDCMWDYILEVKEEGKTTIYCYSSYCGSLNDFTNERSYEFDESVREEITEILVLAYPLGEESQPNEESENVSEEESHNENSSEEPSESSNTVSEDTSFVVYPSYNDSVKITLHESDIEIILGYFNSITDWMDGTCDCLGDYSFEVTENGKTTHFNYSLDDGHLNDSTNQRSYNFSESAREEINKILGQTPKDLDLDE